MIHFHYIGFFDPRRPIDLSERPWRPLPTRPVPPELIERLADRFGVVLGEEVFDEGGYLLSYLGYFDALHPFEAALVAEGCIVLTEMGWVVQPPDAVAAYNESLAEWSVARAEPKVAPDCGGIT